MEEYIKKRLSKLRQELKQKDLDAVLIMKRENYIYLSGFTGSFAHLLITQTHAVLITDFRYTDQAASEAPLYEVVQYQGSLIAVINEVLKSKGVQKLGFEEDFITHSKYVEYQSKLSLKELLPLSGLIEQLRHVKDESELKTIRGAVDIADRGFSHILGYIKPGVRELDIAAELEFFMKKQGAKGTSFETIVASGVRAALPHGVASNKTIEQGDVITLDFGAIYNDYCSDMTRTVFLGTPNEEIKKIYHIVMEAQQTALEGAKAGLVGKEIDFLARDIISRKGFEKNFGHSLGHGVGLEIHEEPRLSPSGNIKMENGMVVTVEPGIYISGLGGVRIEDMIVIEDEKPVILTSSTKEMIII